MESLPDGPLLYAVSQSWSEYRSEFLSVEKGELIGIFKCLQGERETYFFAVSLNTNRHGWIPTSVAVPMRYLLWVCFVRAHVCTHIHARMHAHG
ncbi:hypothetical protein LSH36_527g01057 [Paralvinella palmiformis]|uniref:SH3 domain-containing protein n=1 Tax=Paralvinella palmiformis TaxID=53620 RepID=A0AAD9J7M3_9ANNE|nr:hypothetical protein LSH36_527g01057 [Paralvinella palmiformis]